MVELLFGLYTYWLPGSLRLSTSNNNHPLKIFECFLQLLKIILRLYTLSMLIWPLQKLTLLQHSSSNHQMETYKTYHTIMDGPVTTTLSQPWRRYIRFFLLTFVGLVPRQLEYQAKLKKRLFKLKSTYLKNFLWIKKESFKTNI